MKIDIELQGQNKLVLKTEKLSKLANKIVKEVVNESALEIGTMAMKLCPVDTGRLRSSIHPIFYRNGMAADIGTNVFYAPHVEFGTKPHDIRPRSKKALSWISHQVFDVAWSGRVFAKIVHHPGTPPRPFLFPAFEMERPNFERNLRNRLEGLK